MWNWKLISYMWYAMVHGPCVIHSISLARYTFQRRKKDENVSKSSYTHTHSRWISGMVHKSRFQWKMFQRREKQKSNSDNFELFKEIFPQIARFIHFDHHCYSSYNVNGSWSNRMNTTTTPMIIQWKNYSKPKKKKPSIIITAQTM